MEVQRLSPEGASRPTGSYSTLAIVPAGMSLVWISGQTGRRDDAGIASGIEEQTREAFANLRRAIERIGLSPLDIVHLRTYLAGREGLSGFNQSRSQVFADWFGGAPPASTLLIVTGLADSRAQVEVEAVVAGEPTGLS